MAPTQQQKRKKRPLPPTSSTISKRKRATGLKDKQRRRKSEKEQEANEDHETNNVNVKNNIVAATEKAEIKPYKPIYRDSKKKCVYYESCVNIPIPFHVYVSSARPPENQNGEYPFHTIHVNIGDVVIVQMTSSDTSPPPKRLRERNKQWYPFDVPWTTCQVLTIYQNEKKKSKKTMKNPTAKPTCRFKARFFYRKTEVNKTYISKKQSGKVKAMNRDRISTAITKKDQKEMEEVLESDLLFDLDVHSILGKAFIDLPKNNNTKRITTQSQLIREQYLQQQERNQTGILSIQQYCLDFFHVNGTEQSLYSISPENGSCHYDTTWDDNIVKFIDRKRALFEKDRIDIFWFLKFCRGMQSLKSTEGDFDQGLIKGSLKYAYEEAKLADVGNIDNKEDGKNDFNGDGGNNSIPPENQIDGLKNDNEDGSDDDDDDDDDDQIIHDGSDNGSGGDEFATPTKAEMKLLSTSNLNPPTPRSAASSIAISKGWTITKPFHVNVSALKAFYSEINVVIPFESYADPYNKKRKGFKDYIQFSIGDAVAVHVEEKAIDTYPYLAPWWPAEIVSIYSKVDSQDDALHLSGVVSSNEEYDGDARLDDYFLEIRWLYRKHDIPGISNTKSSIKPPDGIDEVFETDCIFEINASALLGPVTLFSDPHSEQRNITINAGVPTVNFFCHQFYSVQRKSLMAIGSSENRLQRAFLFSNYMGRETATRAALGSEKVADAMTFDHNQNWKKAFHDTFSKLTLAESSVIGNEKEYRLIGRETERQQISQFLKSAIHAAHNDETFDEMNTNKFVLFIGGAPGTGKTASVKSIIYNFYQEQAKGNIPSFQFVSINGMEMRHPFDAYISLWESVSKQKEICPAEEALAKLELYFGGNPNLKKKAIGNTNGRDVFVVLVDEIDYLVTKKQTVLYNLFDWPNRGFSSDSTAQLVVIGISNTLNLPERLHTRLQSRIGSERCMYASYRTDESVSILKGKLGIIDVNTSIFSQDAILFAARKISSESGDIRKVFHLCKAAAENVYNDILSGKRVLQSNTDSYIGVVHIPDIQKASRKMFHSAIQKGVADSTDIEALLFVSLASLKRQFARDSGGFDMKDIVAKMDGMASSFGDKRYIPSPTCAELLGMLDRLGEARIISLHTSNERGTYHSGTFNTMVSLQLDGYEILSALKDTQHRALAEKFLSNS